MGAGAAQNNEFLAEAREHLATVCDVLLNLERSRPDEALERFDRLLRAVHSIKGGAGFLGHQAIQRVAHAFESVVEAARQGQPPLDSHLVDSLLAATDLLTALLDDLDHSNDWDLAPILTRLDALLTAPTAVPPAPPPESIPTPDAPLSLTSSFDLDIDLNATYQGSGLDLLAVVTQLSSLGEIVAGHLEVPELRLNQLAAGVPVQWCATIASPTNSAAFQQLCEGIGLKCVAPDASAPTLPSPSRWERGEGAAPPSPSRWERGGGEGAPPSSEPVPPQPARPVPPPSSAGPDRGGTLRISVNLVDRLMTLAGELVLARNQTRRYADQNQPLPASVAQRLSAVTSEFQEVILQTRMQPVGQLFNKFPRLIRDLARQLGKQIELKMVGTEVELDKSILDAMSDPLTHLVRNSCDHGIEMPDVREQNGKPRFGTITLTARHLGDQIAIEISDDGGGIDRERVKQQALKQGLRSAEQLGRLDDRELLGLILLPGFSTAATVTDVSGRGVGMDVVKTSIEQQSGHLEIRSAQGQGTTFTLRLPLTLAIIPCLMVKAGGQQYALPQKDLEELVCVHSGQTRVRIERTTDREFARLRGCLLPLVRLEEVLRYREPLSESVRQQLLRAASPTAGDQPILFAVVRAGSHRYALVVDQVESSEEIVVKPMHGCLRHLPVFSGATILGDGTVSLILSCEGIAQHAQIRFGEDAQATERAVEESVESTQPVLVCRNSSPEPLAVGLHTIRRIVMVHRQQIETVGRNQFVTIDGVATRLVKLEQLTPYGVTADLPVLFALLPRETSQPLALVVERIVDTTSIGPRVQPPATATAGVVGMVVLQDRVTLVLDLNQLAKQLDADAPHTPTDNPGTRGRILLVEDTQFFRELVRGFLESEGYSVTVAEQGQAGLEALDRESFDLIISDLEMPVLDGWLFAAAVRQRPDVAQLPMLALTTLSGDTQRQRALDQGFDEFLIKVDRSQLLAAVERLLQTNRAQRTRENASHA